MAYKHKKTGELYIPRPGSAWDKKLAASDDYEKATAAEVKKAEKTSESESATGQGA